MIEAWLSFGFGLVTGFSLALIIYGRAIQAHAAARGEGKL